MKASVSKKEKVACAENLKDFKAACRPLIEDFDAFIAEQCSQDETFKFWNSFLTMMTKVENLVRSDRLGDWKLQLQTIQDLLPVFAAFDSTNYFRWCSLFLEDMYRLPEISPTTNEAFLEGKFSIKQTPGFFNAVGADMALEQTINKSQKSVSGIIGNSRKKSYVAKWEILYHEMLAVTNLHRRISGSIQTSYEQDVNRTFSAACTNSDERDIQAIIDVIDANENPFSGTKFCKKLHNIMTNEIVPEDISKQLLNAETIGQVSYAQFREKRFLQKSERISDTIHRNNIPTFASIHRQPLSKKTTPRKKLKAEETKIQRELDIAKERGHAMSELLQYDIGTSSYLFDEEGLMKTATKSDLTKELEKHLPEESPRVLPASPMQTGYIVDVMANVRKIKANVK